MPDKNSGYGESKVLDIQYSAGLICFELDASSHVPSVSGKSDLYICENGLLEGDKFGQLDGAVFQIFIYKPRKAEPKKPPRPRRRVYN